MNRRRFIANGLALPAALSAMASRRTREARAPFDDLARLVDQRMREPAIPGAALGLIQDGRLEMLLAILCDTMAGCSQHAGFQHGWSSVARQPNLS